MTTVQLLAPERSEDAVSVLREAFFDYPVMQFVLGSEGDYHRRLTTLIRFSVTARILREEPILATVEPTGDLTGVAIVTLPGERLSPPALVDRREEVWAELGLAPRRRYEAYGSACLPFRTIDPHHHLNMIGVRRSHAGTGLGRLLLDAVYHLAVADPESAGVSLDTEKLVNVGMYQHCGWQVLGRAQVSKGLETWGMFRKAERRHPDHHSQVNPATPAASGDSRPDPAV